MLSLPVSPVVNDLNQFRLYGKENGVEASGCCLVFNQNGDWLKEPDVSSSFRSFTNEQNEGFKEPIEADVAGLEDENLPLYQVAYIAYSDEYIAKEKCTIWLPDARRPEFGIRLKPVGKNLKWHKFRIKELKAALTKLIKNSNKIKNEDGKALEYIRYCLKILLSVTRKSSPAENRTNRFGQNRILRSYKIRLSALYRYTRYCG